MSVNLKVRTHVRQARVDELLAVLTEHTTLERVLAWCRLQTPPLGLAEIVTQDEYTHDVLLPLADGLVLVYDVT